MIVSAKVKDYPEIVNVWELSVRATHDFLPEEYLQEIKQLLPSLLPHVRLFVWRHEDGTIKGFTGVAEQKMEMLFIHPESRGQGIGRQLAHFCIYQLNADQVDVNEQNEQAVNFYKKMGYKLIGRKDLDSMGRPFPILEMQYFS